MTISSTLSAKQYVSTGVNTQFAYPNKVFAATDLVVTIFDLSGNPFPFTNFGNGALGLTYSVQGVDVDTGCTVVLSGPFTLNWTMDIRTQTALTQSTSIKNQGQFLPELHEEAFDRVTREIQDLLRLTYTFGIHGPDTETIVWPALPGPNTRKGNALMFDPATGLPTLGVPNTQTITTGLLAPFLNLQQTPAEIAVGVTPTNLGYVTGNVLRYGADPTGVADSATAFLNAQKVATQGAVELLIPGGTYKCGTTLAWGFANLQVTATGKVVINFTNAGQCITIDGGAGGAGIVGVTVKGYIRAVGNAGTTDAWFVRACHHSYLTMRAGDCFVGLRVNWCVATKFDFVCSSNEAAFTVLVPTTGMFLTQRGAGETTAGCTFITPVLEGITTGVGVGIDLRDTFQNVFLGGTSEGNTVGCRQVGANNVGNAFIGTDFEVNTSQDFIVTGGSNLTFQNINSSSAISGIASIDLQGGDNTTFIGGFLRWVGVATSPTVTGTGFYNCQISDAGGVGIVKAAGAIIKAVGVQKVSAARAVTSWFTDDIGNKGTLADQGAFTPIIFGGTTPGVQTYAANGQKGYYQIIGHVVFFSIWLNLASNAGGTGNAVIGGLPISTRNLTNLFQTIAIADYTGVTLGAAGRTLGMRLNQGVTTGLLIETDTGSVSNLLAIGAVGGTALIIVNGSYLID